LGTQTERRIEKECKLSQSKAVITLAAQSPLSPSIALDSGLLMDNYALIITYKPKWKVITDDKKLL
jgi:hypothetical protein